MNDGLKFYRELARLKEGLVKLSSYPNESTWLKSPFESDIWLGSFARSQNIQVNFSVALDDGSLLTDKKNTEFLTVIKAWLCMQDKPTPRTGIIPQSGHLYSRVTTCFVLIDYFLLRSKRFRLGEFGFALVTENDLDMLFKCLASSSHMSMSVYEWPARLKTFLDEASSSLDIDAILQQEPRLTDFSIQDPNFLGVADPKTILRYRAFLWKAGYYRRITTHAQHRSFAYAPDTKAIAALLYPDTLRGVSPKLVPPELKFIPVLSSKREKPAVPVRFNKMANMNRREMSSYASVLSYAGSLHALEANFPVATLQPLDRIVGRAAKGARQIQRFTTLPARAVLGALQGAIEFYLQYGEGIVSTYLAIIEKCEEEPANKNEILYGARFSELICPSLSSLKILAWDVAYSPEPPIGGQIRPTISDHKLYYEQVRRGVSFWHLLMTLYGCAIVTVGALMARRVSEIMTLPCLECIDLKGRYLLFGNAKSGSHGIRQKEARPIPEIAVRMIRTMQRLQIGLKAAKSLQGYTYLFALPHRTDLTLTKNANPSPDRALDIFCDYFEIEADQQGRRYYFRLHQLRRFFAMAFFWGGAPGGSDTLRWFLGHTDIRHLYHYITESTPGSVLNSVKASISSELVRRDDKSAHELAVLCEKHFGSRNFTVLTDGDLEEYLEELVASGDVTVEPNFFSENGEERYQLIIVVKEKRNDTSAEAD
ncbi:hypothetical protein [Kordiimonas sp.]|uniref:hypothetical protein n=1 Tax=Kordiimonas sp. TaxID=1970157 RepID=UPI003B51A133